MHEFTTEEQFKKLEQEKIAEIIADCPDYTNEESADACHANSRLASFYSEAVELLFKKRKEFEAEVEKKANEKLKNEVKRLDEMAQTFITKKVEQEGKLITERADKYSKLLEDTTNDFVEAKQKEFDKEVETYKKKISDLEEQLDFKERVLDKISWDTVIEAENEVYDELGIPEENR